MTMLCIFRRVAPALLLSVLAVVGLAGCRDGVDVERVSARETRKADTPADPNVVRLGEDQRQSMTVETVEAQPFRLDKNATGHIAFDEDRMTPVFSPFTGRVVRLFAALGDEVKKGSPLFEIDTPDLVQAESDLISAHAALLKARSQVDLTRRTAVRQQDLYDHQAAALKDVEQARADQRNAESDLRAAEGTLAGARDRLRVFGKTEAEIATIEERRQIDRLAIVRAPIAGTIIARKLGPGQFVKPDNPDPLFTVADLSTMWLLANVYETDIPYVSVGQPVDVEVLAYPNETFHARISYIGAASDPTTHRIAVRAEVSNRRGKLKPEMFASFHIMTNETTHAPAVPAGAIVREGDVATVWVETGTGEFQRRPVKLGPQQGDRVQVVDGLQPGERVVTRGAVFLATAASGGK